MERARLAQAFKALGSDVRLGILEVLWRKQQSGCCAKGAVRASIEEQSLCCVDEIVEEFGLAQSTISQHLKELHRAGLLERHKQAQWVYYVVNEEAMGALAETLAAYRGGCG